MAKPKQKTEKTTKKRSLKYGKLAAVCSKELSEKKTALIRSEKALAKAQKTHTELLAEVARLDMLDRSLKALINGTEAPQNVRYVYTYPQWVYPQWVWHGSNAWYWNGNGLSQNGQVLNSLGQWTSNVNVQTNPPYTTTVTTPSTSGTYEITTALGNLAGAQCNFNVCDAGNLSLTSSASCGSSLQGAVTVTDPNFTLGSQITVDLSTGATEAEPSETELGNVLDMTTGADD